MFYGLVPVQGSSEISISLPGDAVEVDFEWGRNCDFHGRDCAKYLFALKLDHSGFGGRGLQPVVDRFWAKKSRTLLRKICDAGDPEPTLHPPGNDWESALGGGLNCQENNQPDLLWICVVDRFWAQKSAKKNIPSKTIITRDPR